jgi:hypothetical protein
MKYKFYVKQIPDPFSIWRWIRDHSNIENIISKMAPAASPDELINLNHSLDIDSLSSTTLTVLDQYGYKGWRGATGEAKEYGGLSLVMNPDYTEHCDLNQQTLGTDKNLPTQFFYGQFENFSTLRNSYYDSYAFRKPAPCVAETKLLDFVQSFKRSHVRSRIGVINSKYVSDESRKSFNWHRDELVFENTRINIPIKTDNTFMFEIKGKPPTHLEYGNMYSWDTNIAHRVFPTTTENTSRVHLVLGFSPWFDYNSEEDAWISNEFYGEMHPLDMLVQGHFHDSIIGRK